MASFVFVWTSFDSKLQFVQDNYVFSLFYYVPYLSFF